MNFDKTWIFQDSVSTTGTGVALCPNQNNQVTIYITGTSTSRTINFEGCDSEGNWYSACATRLPDLTIASSTTGNNEVWIFDTSPWNSIRCNVFAIAGGTVRITGKVVSV